MRSGFTLVEMSVVLVIVGLLILTIFPALTVMRVSGQRSVTQNNLDALLKATAAFVQANGCLPCPTPAATIGAGFGRVRGDTGVAACGGCATAEGIPPFVSLGIAPSIAHDGWGHWITMRVDPALTAATFGTVVPPASVCTAADMAATPLTPTCVTLNASQKGLCQAGLGATNRVNVQTPSGANQKVAVLFVSHGARGYGAFIAAANRVETGFNNGCRYNFPRVAAACQQSLTCVPTTGSGAAQCNATGANQFVNATPQQDYDDLMVFADRNVLVSMLGNGSCQTVW